MSNKPYKRNERLACQLLDMLKKEIWLIHGNVCNITHIKLSKDFKYADVYLQTNIEDHIKMLQESERELIRQIKPKWNAKYIPNLRFHIDKEAARIDQLREICSGEDF